MELKHTFTPLRKNIEVCGFFLNNHIHFPWTLKSLWQDFDFEVQDRCLTPWLKWCIQIHITYPSASVQTLVLFLIPDSGSLGDSRAWLRHLGPHHLYRGITLSSWFLNLVWLNPSCCEHIGSETVDEKSISLFSKNFVKNKQSSTVDTLEFLFMTTIGIFYYQWKIKSHVMKATFSINPVSKMNYRKIYQNPRSNLNSVLKHLAFNWKAATPSTGKQWMFHRLIFAYISCLVETMWASLSLSCLLIEDKKTWEPDKCTIYEELWNVINCFFSNISGISKREFNCLSWSVSLLNTATA